MLNVSNDEECGAPTGADRCEVAKYSIPERLLSPSDSDSDSSDEEETWHEQPQTREDIEEATLFWERHTNSIKWANI